MEQKDDFESLLKGVAARYDEALPSEQPVSEMIDTRVSGTGKRLIYSFIKEMLIILLCAIFVVGMYLWALHKYQLPERTLTAYNLLLAIALVYFALSIILYVWLLQLSATAKGTDIKKYVTSLYRNTKLGLKAYLWTSTVVNSSLIPVLLMMGNKGVIYWIIIIPICTVVIHKLNVCYINKRFGNRLRELESLAEAFND
jgi:hypothetical protein